MRRSLILILLFTFACDSDREPSFQDAKIDTEFFIDGEVETIFENNIENGVNVVILGDGYTKKELGKNFGKYQKDLKRMSGALFNKPPFSTYKNDFNMYMVYAESAKSEITIGNPSQDNTAFGLTVYNGQFDLNLIKLKEYASRVIPNQRQVHLILLLTNYNLNGRAFKGSLAIFDKRSEKTMLHEVGHAFAYLGEEYINNWESSIGRPNIDSTNQLNSIKWSHFIGLQGYSKVGAYPGSNNLWLPEPYSLMGNNPLADSYNAPSREAIVKRIMEIKGTLYDFNEFLIKDVKN